MRFIVHMAALLLSGCTMYSKKAVDFTCPKIGLVAGAERVVFTDANGIVAEAVIDGFSGDCSLKNEAVAEINLTLPFVVKKGVAGQVLQDKELSYFIAVLSPEEEVLQRQAFTAAAVFDNADVGSATEEHRLKIPLSSPQDGYKYKVAFGFALTPEQQKYNEEHKK